MWAHPGKKLLFMGGEFAQEREWNHDRGLDWYHLEDPLHAGIRDLVRDLNKIYRQQKALHERWIVKPRVRLDRRFRQRPQHLHLPSQAKEGALPVVAACNFTPVVHETYRIACRGRTMEGAIEQRRPAARRFRRGQH